MRDTRTTDSDRNESEQPDLVNYLPGMPRLSSSPGRVERFLTRLFRRRGGFRVIARRKD